MILTRLALFLTLPAAALAADYERALSLAKRTENKVFRRPPEIHWLPEGSRFWYSVQTAPAASEWVLVEPEIGKVTRTPDFASLGLPAAAPPSRSRASDEQTRLRFDNRRAEPVELFWLDLAGRRQPYGRVQAGEVREMRTFAGHVWLVVDPLGGVLAHVAAAGDSGEVVISRDAQPLPTREDEETPRPSPNRSPDGRWSARMRARCSRRVGQCPSVSWPKGAPGGPTFTACSSSRRTSILQKATRCSRRFMRVRTPRLRRKISAV